MRLPARSPIAVRSRRKTSLTVLCDQLDLLGSKMDDVFDAVCRAMPTADAHGRFLAREVRFRRAGPRPRQR